MKYRHPQSSTTLSAILISVGLAGTSPATVAEEAAAPSPARAGVGVATGVVPGGAIVSAKSVIVAPVAGGDGVAVPIAGDGTFRIEGLQPGRYRLVVSSTPVAKQTQGATFGEKVNAGLHAAGSAVATGVGSKTKHETVKNSVGNIRRESAPPAPPATPTPMDDAAKLKIDGGMPNRISMNVTVPKQVHVVDLDGAPVEVDVDPSGRLSGTATAR